MESLPETENLRNYTSASDEAARFAVFEQRYAEVTAHNADAETTFRQGLNHLTDRLPPELKQLGRSCAEICSPGPMDCRLQKNT